MCKAHGFFPSVKIEKQWARASECQQESRATAWSQKLNQRTSFGVSVRRCRTPRMLSQKMFLRYTLNSPIQTNKRSIPSTCALLEDSSGFSTVKGSRGHPATVCKTALVSGHASEEHLRELMLRVLADDVCQLLPCISQRSTEATALEWTSGKPEKGHETLEESRALLKPSDGARALSRSFVKEIGPEESPNLLTADVLPRQKSLRSTVRKQECFKEGIASLSEIRCRIIYRICPNTP